MNKTMHRFIKSFLFLCALASNSLSANTLENFTDAEINELVTRALSPRKDSVAGNTKLSQSINPFNPNVKNSNAF